jgi:hypothetical protein
MSSGATGRVRGTIAAERSPDSIGLTVAVRIARAWNLAEPRLVEALVTSTTTNNSNGEPMDEARQSFAVTWDYRCPFARNAHEHLVAALEAGASYEVTFLGFSLSQAHLGEDDVSVWDAPEKDTGGLAMQVGIVVRDKLPEQFLSVHRSLFSLRHDGGGDLRDESALRQVLSDSGVDADYVFGEIESGWPLDTFHKEHEVGVRDHAVWGVPTFVAEDQAVFVRLMTRPAGDGAIARRTIDGVLSLLTGMPELNEYKHTSIDR